MIRYLVPTRWIQYDVLAIVGELTSAKAVVLSLNTVPYQKRWVEDLQRIELKREVAGTSRIEGAEFTDRELDAAMKESPEELLTRSQRQAHAATMTYHWIATIPDDRPIDDELIREIHRRMVTGADDDHCPPGQLRGQDENVNFGMPRHRGVEGGDACAAAFRAFTAALQQEYRGHDPIVQAIAAHYHFAAMHPFLDGNGRTARALEALLLQRAGLRNTSFIAMSNYYYEEKNDYLRTLAATQQSHHDLTAFLRFALKGVAQQGNRSLGLIQDEIRKQLYRNLMYDLFRRLESPRKRVMAERQIKILARLLEVREMDLTTFVTEMLPLYRDLHNPMKALNRDLFSLISLDTIHSRATEDGRRSLWANLDWPAQMTETDFFRKVRELPSAKSTSFLE